MLRLRLALALMAWLAAPAVCQAMEREVDTFIVHHSATDQGTVESIRRYHMNVRGWDNIGYHFLVTKDGQVHEGRPLHIQGAHARGRNRGSIGICLIGKDVFSDLQVRALLTLLDTLGQEYPGARIEHHHEECP